MQIAVIEFARNVCGLKKASSTEFDEMCEEPIIDLMSEQKSVINMQACMLSYSVMSDSLELHGL